MQKEIPGESEPLCLDCDQPRETHKGKRHPFRSSVDQPSLGERKDRQNRMNDSLKTGRIQQIPPPATLTFPIDPVLRTALIDAGILTLEQLENAERKIRATMPAFPSLGSVLRGLDDSERTGAAEADRGDPTAGQPTSTE